MNSGGDRGTACTWPKSEYTLCLAPGGSGFLSRDSIVSIHSVGAEAQGDDVSISIWEGHRYILWGHPIPDPEGDLVGMTYIQTLLQSPQV
jgi:hypothetical protein